MTSDTRPTLDRQSTTPRSTVVGAYIALTAALFALAGAFTNEKLAFLYKDALHLTAGDVATLAVILGIPAYIRPFLGAGADLVPLFGYHRRSYFILGCLVMTAGYAGLALTHDYRYLDVLWLVMIAGAGGIFAIVILDAVMVAVGNVDGAIARLQTIQRGVPLVLALLFTARLSGYVAQHWTYQACFTAAALISLLTAPLALLIPERRVQSPSAGALLTAPNEQELMPGALLIALDEQESTATPTRPTETPRRQDRPPTAAALRDALRTPGLWAMIGFIFYLIVTPGTGTAQFYYVVDVLHFSKQLIGNLGMASSTGSIVGILTFAALSRRLPVRAMVWGAYLSDCAVYLTLFLLHNVPTGFAVSFIHSAITSIYMLCLYTLAARACPPGIEGTIYGLVLAAISLALNLGEKLGATIYDRFGPSTHHSTTFGWHSLLWFGLGFTLIALAFIPFLPAWAKSREPLHPTSEKVRRY